MILSLGALGGWRDLPFFEEDLPDLIIRLKAEPVPVYPPADQVFAALERCQPKDTRVVILGQDPYHTPGKADGLAFSIPATFKGRLDSLGNIFKELEADLGKPRTRTHLQDWASQGVLLLNTALTVSDGKAGSHAKLGWRLLVDQVLAHLADQPIAYVLWGGAAQKIGRHIAPGSNLKIETAHPSPLSAHRGFFGSRPFSKVNTWLIEQGQSPIDWTGP